MNRPWTPTAFLVDLDGTLLSGAQAYPRAAAFLRHLGERCAIVSNDAESTPLLLSGKLRRLGLALPPERIVLAGTAALEHVAARHPGARLMLLGSPALRRHAKTLGLDTEAGEPEVVLLARDRAFSYAKLARAANALRGGAALVVANPDLVHPGPGGAVIPETGALLAALEACAGPVARTVVGKPEPILFRRALDVLGVAAADAVMIGDNPDTDGVGAARLGIRFLQVEPGELPDPDCIAARAGR